MTGGSSQRALPISDNIIYILIHIMRIVMTKPCAAIVLCVITAKAHSELALFKPFAKPFRLIVPI